MPGQIVQKSHRIDALLLLRLALLMVVVVSFILFFVSSIVSFNQNDFMYGVAAAVWGQHGKLYTDVPFVQAPLSIMLNLLFAEITGSVDIFLIARMTSILFVLAAVVIPLLGRAKDGDLAIWMLYVALCLSNALVISNSSEIGNYAIALFCLSLSVAIINGRGAVLWRGFIAFAMIGLAVSSKLYFIVICPGLFTMFLINDASARRPDVIAGCFLGLLVGCAPMLYFLISDYQSFVKWNVTVFRWFLDARQMEAAESLIHIERASSIFAILMLIPIVFAVAVVVEEYRECGPARVRAGNLILLVFAYLMAISPVNLHGQYWAPLALLLFQFSVPWRISSKVFRLVFVGFSTALFCVQGLFTLNSIAAKLNRSGGVALLQVLELKRHAREIVDTEYKCERKFYSAEPLFLLDNKVKYPPELAAGPFLLFLGRRDLKGIGSDFDITTSIKRWNPDVVIWGYYLGSKVSEQNDVDRAISDYAIRAEFKVTLLGPIDGRDIFLGYRADCKM